jgi:hypothetical protein
VYSENICINQQAGKLKNGVSKELGLAESIANQDNHKDFRILLKIDDSAFNLFIGANDLTQVPFYENWALGLEQLLQKLEKDNVPKFEFIRDNGFGEWYENEMTTKNGVIEKKELYYSNWWAIKQLPESFFIYQYQTEKQAKLIYENESSFPTSKISNCLSSFSDVITSSIEHEGSLIEIKPVNIFEVKINEVLLGFENEDFPNHRDTENHFKQLLKRIFHLIMKNRKMYWFEMSNRKLAYYYTPANLNTLKVKFKYPFRGEKRKTKTKNLLGTYQYKNHWHYAVSVKPILSPIVGYSLKNHLTFSDDGFKSWDDKDKIHSHRRRKAKASKYFNEAWRDFQCAFLNALKNKDDKIEIQLSNSFTLQMTSWTEMYWSDFGYFEPKDKERQGLMSDFYESEDEEDEEELKVE